MKVTREISVVYHFIILANVWPLGSLVNSLPTYQEVLS